MKARKYIQLFFALFLVAAQVTVHAQSKVLGDYVISDPQTWSFMKYGGQTPDLYTGTVRAEIPIYTYKDQDFEIPISLRYASSGFMPNVQANYVGLGWALDVGGCITRKVNGIRDEDVVDCLQQTTFGVLGNELHGYYKYSCVAHESGSILNRRHYALEIADSNLGYEYCYYNENDTLYYETKPDVFSFSFLGNSGKFVIDENGIARVFDSSKPAGEISVDLSGLSLGYFKSQIILKTGDGYEYEFGGLLAANDIDIHDTIDRSSASGSRLTYRSDIWHLRRITAPNGRQVNFFYTIAQSSTMTPRGARSSRSIINAGGGGLQESYYESSGYYQEHYLQFTTYVAQLSSIQIDNKVEVRFSYATDRPDEKYTKFQIEGELPTPDRLSEIHVLDTSSSSEISLRDCYLTHIYGTTNPVMMLSSVRIAGHGTYEMNYHGENGPFPCQGCVQIDHWGFYNSNPQNTVASLLPDVSTSDDYTEVVNSVNRNPDVARTKLGMLIRMKYPTGGWTDYEYEMRTYGKRIVRSEHSGGLPLLEEWHESAAGGLRVKAVTDHASASTYSRREYDYGTGNMLLFPRYANLALMSTNGAEHFVDNVSTASTNGYMMDGTYIEYGTVTERFADSSYVVHNFRNYEDTPDVTDVYDSSTSWLNDSFSLPSDYRIPSSATAFNYFREIASRCQIRGKKSSTEYYSASNSIQKRETYGYADGVSRYVAFAAITAGARYEGRYLLPYCDLTSVTTEMFSPDANVVSNTVSYSYNSLRQKKSESLTSSDGVTRRKNRFYVQDIYPGARTSAESAMAARNVTAFPIYESESVTDAAGTWLVSARHNIYTQSGNMFLLSSVGEGQVAGRQQYANTIPVSIPYRTVATYGSFNSQGRPCAVTDSNGIQSLLLWGYGGLYPVALIGNCTIPSFSSSGISLTSDLGWSGLVGAQEPRVRSIPGASVTTWKYLPFVGVSEKIGPDGRKTTYDYDDYGRLVSVKDTDDDKVEEYHYNIITE